MTTLPQDIQEIIADYQKVRNDIIHNHSILNKVAETLYFLKTEKTEYNNIPAYSTSNDLEISRQNKAKGYENAILTDSLFDILAYRGIGAGYHTFYDLPLADVERSRFILDLGKSRALFKNYFHALNRIVNACEFEVYLQYNSTIMPYWFKGDALSHLQDLDFASNLLKKDEAITSFQINIGGVKIDVDLTAFRQAVENMRENIYLHLNDEHITDLFIHLYLKDILSHFPNLDNEDEVSAFLTTNDKEHTNQAILKIEEELAKLGVTQLFGEFTLPSEMVASNVINLVSKIFYMKEKLDAPEKRSHIITPYEVSQRIKYARRGSFIHETYFQFAISNPKRNEKGLEVVTLKIRPNK
jgi:hypothetical protein